MYETEANRNKESQEQIPAEVVVRLREATRTVLDRTVLPWSEHCTECVWPTCYSSCDLYTPREDGKCRRFVHGMVRVDCPDAVNSYLLKVTFKRWGKLWAPGNIHLRSMEKARRMEQRDYFIGTMLYELPAPASIKGMVTGKRYSLKKRLAYRSKGLVRLPTSFFLECYNPASDTIRLSLNICASGQKLQIPFQKLIELAPGFHRLRVPYLEIAKVVDLTAPFNVELIPNHDTGDLTLFFGLIDFVREIPAPNTTTPRQQTVMNQKVKCVVWDLDHTLWEGILVEDGLEKLTLKTGVRQIIEELDRRGILQSIASKNNHDEALGALKQFGMEDFFLAPQVSWQPKSDAIQDIARQLNIGLDSLLFIDDSEFERRQVSDALPEVRTIDARQYRQILDMDECNVPVTAESRERRKMYRTETQRQTVAAGFADNYIAFLRHCDIRLNVRPMSEANLERVHELTQRTNQMNFSGNRYDRSVLKQILATSYLHTYVLEVEDRFGTYGVVGFSIVDVRELIVTDLMFSCRIQSKRVEHAFLAYLVSRYAAGGENGLRAKYRQTTRNAASGKVFADIGMQEVENKDGVSLLTFPKGQIVSDEGIVKITAN
jgi:FkbH-like protein